MSTPTSSRLNARDFINIGVFTALMFVIVFAFGMLGFIPAAMYAGFLLSILVNGTVFALFTARTPKMGGIDHHADPHRSPLLRNGSLGGRNRDRRCVRPAR